MEKVNNMQNKYIVIGDIHGRSTWLGCEKYIQEGYVLVFLGDYFDTHEVYSTGVISDNFLAILELKQSYPDNVILLTGNHDFSYLNENGICSGHKIATQAFVNGHKGIIKDNLKVIHIDGNFIFSHAGVSPVYLTEQNLTLDDLCEMKCDDNKLEFVNKDIHTNIYGDNWYQSPIWIRPQSLIDSTETFQYKQVVGHTPCVNEKIFSHDDRIFFNDRLNFNQVLKVENDSVELLNL